MEKECQPAAGHLLKSEEVRGSCSYWQQGLTARRGHVNFLLGLAAAWCLQQESACWHSIQVLGPCWPTQGKLGWCHSTAQSCTKALELKGEGSSLGRAALGQLSPARFSPTTAIPNIKLFQQGQITLDVCRASGMRRNSWSDTGAAWLHTQSSPSVLSPPAFAHIACVSVLLHQHPNCSNRAGNFHGAENTIKALKKISKL